MSLPFDLWGQRGWAGMDVAGESHYVTSIRALFGSALRAGGSEMTATVQLLPEATNKHDRNAVGVWAGSRQLGYLPRQEAARYSTVLSALVARGWTPQVSARIWAAGSGRDVAASVRLQLAEPHMLVPANQAPGDPHSLLPTGTAIQVTGEEKHLAALVPWLRPEGECWVHVTLHEVTEQLARSSRTVVEVRLDGARVGQLTPKMSGDLLPAIRHLAAGDLATAARAVVKGNRIKAEVVLYAARAHDLPESWLAAGATSKHTPACSMPVVSVPVAGLQSASHRAPEPLQPALSPVASARASVPSPAPTPAPAPAPTPAPAFTSASAPAFTPDPDHGPASAFAAASTATAAPAVLPVQDSPLTSASIPASVAAPARGSDTASARWRFQAPPNWPAPPAGWQPPPGWAPDPAWGPVPPGWRFWVTETPAPPVVPQTSATPQATTAPSVGQRANSAPAGAHASSASAGVHASSAPPGMQASQAPPAAQAPPAVEADVPFFGARGKARELAAEVTRLRAENDQLRAEMDRLGVSAVRELQEYRRRLDREITERAVTAEAEQAKSQARLDELRQQVVVTEELVLLQEAGVYRYQHPLSDAVAYQDAVAQLQDQIKALAKADGGAVATARGWTVNGSESQGRAMLRDYSKLMLRAYNAEADNLVRTLKPYKLEAAIDRLGKVAATIARLGRTMDIRITEDYHRLRVRELGLTADFLQKSAEEKERDREEKARLREERRIQQEIERERARLDKERQHYANALATLQANGDAQGAAQLRERLAQIDTAIQDVDYRAANVRAGYVYVISNLGAFGENMIKVGMTRRLDPMDRVRELGDASVPFAFDVHALFFSDDAAGIEAQMHARLADRRVNLVNQRREFFRATPAEAKQHLMELTGSLLQYEEIPEALEYRQSRSGTARQGGAAS